MIGTQVAIVAIDNASVTCCQRWSFTLLRKDHEIVRVARDIELYLLEHPAAADSVEGVLKWWLARHRYQEALYLVQEALEVLVAEGRIKKAINADGTCIYRNAKGQNQIRDNA